MIKMSYGPNDPNSHGGDQTFDNYFIRIAETEAAAENLSTPQPAWRDEGNRCVTSGYQYEGAADEEMPEFLIDAWQCRENHEKDNHGESLVLIPSPILPSYHDLTA